MPRFLKTTLITGAMYGVVLWLFLWFIFQDPKQALMWAVPGAVIFGVALAAMNESSHKEFEGRFVGAAGERLLREGMARRWDGKPSAWTGKNHVGYLRVTNQRVVFTPRAANKTATAWDIPLANISGAAAYTHQWFYPMGLRITTADGEENFLVTFGANNEWAAAITQARG